MTKKLKVINESRTTILGRQKADSSILQQMFKKSMDMKLEQKNVSSQNQTSANIKQNKPSK